MSSYIHPSITELQNEACFQRAEVIEHDDMMRFISAYFFRLNPIILIFLLLNLISLAVWIVTTSLFGFDIGIVVTTGLAVLGMFPLIPLHEWIHGLVYKAQGATDVRYGGSLWKLYFYAIAHRFVVSSRQLVVVALAPLVVISLLCILLALVSPPATPFAMALLFMHATAASGDFAILSYLWEQRDKTIYTYDDADTRKSYFFIMKEETREK
jgi:hypothetical protein